MKIKEAYQMQSGEISALTLGEFYEGTIERPLLNIYPVEKQTVLGFGGAFTDSAAYNYAQMDADTKQAALEALFGADGLGYNFCRLCIGSSDFAVEEYCYVEDGDSTLSTFSIARDRKYVIPFVKDALSFTNGAIKLFASPWSPPAFMKDNGSRLGGGKLKFDCYALYAEYLAKFLLAYKAEGINISMLTLQNEAKARQTWESCQYTAEEEAAFAEVVYDTLKKHALDVKILFWDHNKERLYERAAVMYKRCPDKVAGIAFHWYSGDHFEAIDMLRELYPDKLLVQAEFCRAGGSDYVPTSYAREILCDLRSGTNVVCEWNLILDEDGGPYHNRKDGCDAPLRYNSETGKFETTHIYKEMYLFSHFIKPGARTLYTSSFNANVFVCACRNPDGSVVVNVINEKDDAFEKCKLYIEGKFLDLPLVPHSTVTVVIA